jgi:hypothetical protein
LYSNTTGSYNAAHGYRALYSNTTGESNSAVGYQALYFNTTGVNNTAHGFRALYSNTTSANNSATGIYALYNNTTGANNTATGTNALISNTTGANNSAVGRDALYYNTIGGNNTAHGYRALYNTTTVVVTLGTITGGSGYTDGTYTSVLMTYVSGSTAVTYPTATIVVAGGVVTTVTLTSFGVGFKDTTTVLSAAAASIGGTGSGFTVPVATISSGDSNTAIGRDALYSNKQGGSNTATGLSALFSNTTGSGNVATGTSALRFNTTGSNNTANGYEALYSIQWVVKQPLGFERCILILQVLINSAVGYQALYLNTTGANNTAIGIFSSEKNTTGTGNAALGYAALYRNTTGNNNIAVGLNAGRFIDGGADNTITSNSVFLGQNTRALAISQTNQIVIGESAVGLGSNTAILGNSSITKTQLQGNVGIGTDSPGSKLQVYTGNTANANNGITLMRGAGFDVFGIKHRSDAGGIYRGAITYDAAEVMTFLINGNIGIGTTNPSSLLHISSGTSGDATLIIEADTDNSNENDNPKLQFRQDGGLVSATAGITGDAGTVFTNSLMNATYLGSEGDTPLQLFTNSSAKLTILSNGNVGIGTTAPLGKLDIVGRDLIVGDNRGGDGESRIFLIEGESGVPNSLDYGFSMAYSGRGTMLGLPSNTFGIVRHDNDATGVAVLVIQRSTGNVGIGTTSPKNKLDIVGSLGRGAPVTKTTDFTVAATENWLIMNGAATITITLPTASSFTGRELMIKNIAAYTVISASSNVKPIDTDTAATAILPATAGSWCTLVSDGTNWVTMMN